MSTWRPASECPQNGAPVMALFRWEADDEEPVVVRRLGPDFWTNIVGNRLDVSPGRWRPLADAERDELVAMFPASMPEGVSTP